MPCFDGICPLSGILTRCVVTPVLPHSSGYGHNTVISPQTGRIRQHD
jgi:hypothetical protein